MEWRCATFKSASKTVLPGSSTWNLQQKSSVFPKVRQDIFQISTLGVPCVRFRVYTSSQKFMLTAVIDHAREGFFPHRSWFRDVSMSHQFHQVNQEIPSSFFGQRMYIYLALVNIAQEKLPFLKSILMDFVAKSPSGGRNSFRTFSNEFGCMESWQGSNSHRHCHVSGLVHFE